MANELNVAALGNYRASLPAQRPEDFDYIALAVSACKKAATSAGFEGVLESEGTIALSNSRGEMVNLWVDCPDQGASPDEFHGIGFDGYLEWYENQVAEIAAAERECDAEYLHTLPAENK